MSCTNYILSKKPTGSIVSDTILPASLTGLRGPKGDLGPAGSDASVTSANITAALGYTPIGDAPDTLHQYARTKGAWQTISGGGGNPFDQSLNTTDAVRFASVGLKNGLAGFDSLGNVTSQNLGTMASKNDAPSDGSQYARKDGAWVTFSGGSGGGGVTSFNTRTGDVTLRSSDVTSALGYTPVQIQTAIAFAIAL